MSSGSVPRGQYNSNNSFRGRGQPTRSNSQSRYLSLLEAAREGDNEALADASAILNPFRDHRNDFDDQDDDFDRPPLARPPLINPWSEPFNPHGFQPENNANRPPRFSDIIPPNAFDQPVERTGHFSDIVPPHFRQPNRTGEDGPSRLGGIFAGVTRSPAPDWRTHTFAPANMIQRPGTPRHPRRPTPGNHTANQFVMRRENAFVNQDQEFIVEDREIEEAFAEAFARVPFATVRAARVALQAGDTGPTVDLLLRIREDLHRQHVRDGVVVGQDGWQTGRMLDLDVWRYDPVPPYTRGDPPPYERNFLPHYEP